MTIIEAVATVLADLRTRGWAEILGPHGVSLDDLLAAPDLKGALTGQTFRIDRTQVGFRDFAPDLARLIEPGDPARSLLYHAMASPQVRFDDDESPGGEDRYPDLAQIDTVENFIYACQPLSDVILRTATVAVFAYQYRERERSAHGQHADLVFSRSGIARNGTLPPRFDKRARCFEPFGDENGRTNARVMPARYGVFLCHRQKGVSHWSESHRDGRFALAGGPQPGDDARDFLVPFRKLFSGQPVTDGVPLELRFFDYHLNEKLARAGEIGFGLFFERKFDLGRPPFKIETQVGTTEFDGATFDGSFFVAPMQEPLVRPAVQHLPDGQGHRVVRFKALPQLIPPRLNRRFTSYMISSGFLLLAWEGFLSVAKGVLGPIYRRFFRRHKYPRPRNAPEFVNIRHRIQGEDDRVDGEDAPPTLRNMRDEPADRKSFLRRVAASQRDAVAFVDGCADGYVGARILRPDAGELSASSAYSVLAPPDFFPFVDQLDIHNWFQRAPFSADTQFKQGGPDPLCLGRLCPNPNLGAEADGAQFVRSDVTVAAIVGNAPRRSDLALQDRERPRTTSFLTDASSNVFAPGWDVTYASDDLGKFYATYGLGSPYPEDIKLCAAANAFWPAVGPDASRTFARSDAPTAIPLMDDELGYHRGHPHAPPGVEDPEPGWDGEHGPYIDADGNLNVADIERSDYVANVLDDTLNVAALAKMTSGVLIDRMSALRTAIAAIDDGRTPARTKYTLVSAREVDWNAPSGRGGLSGPGFRFLFAKVESLDDAKAVDGDPRRVTLEIKSDVVRCDVDLLGGVIADPPTAPNAARGLY